MRFKEVAVQATSPLNLSWSCTWVPRNIFAYFDQNSILGCYVHVEPRSSQLRYRGGNRHGVSLHTQNHSRHPSNCTHVRAWFDGSIRICVTLISPHCARIDPDGF